jgi:hypothetical protein
LSLPAIVPVLAPVILLLAPDCESIRPYADEDADDEDKTVAEDDDDDDDDDEEAPEGTMPLPLRSPAVVGFAAVKNEL